MNVSENLRASNTLSIYIHHITKALHTPYQFSSITPIYPQVPLLLELDRLITNLLATPNCPNPALSKPNSQHHLTRN